MKFIQPLTILSFAMSACLTVVQAAQYSDAEISKIIETVNRGEIDLAKVATKSSNQQVKDFAEMMIKDHTQSNKDLKSIKTKSDGNASKSETAASLKADASAKKDELKNLKGSQLDARYIQTQVEMHGKVLGILDNDLIPSATTADLKTFLQKTRGAVAAHHEQAQKIQSTLDKRM